MTLLKLATMTAEMLPAVVELDRTCFGGLWSADAYQREIDSPNSDVLVLMQARPPESQEDSEAASIAASCPPISSPPPLLAIGCDWAILEEAHITIIAVDPHYQRQGLGQAMLYALMEAAHQRQLERATLEVRVSNTAAIALYEKFGFQKAGHRRGYYPDTKEDALVLWRSGLHRPEFQQALATWRKEVSDRLKQSGWQGFPEV